MIKLFERLIQEYEAATVFVGAATIVVIIELSMMRVLVPAPASADNYDALANQDDGTCEFTIDTACPGDLDGDGWIITGDLLLFLALFGTPC